MRVEIGKDQKRIKAEILDLFCTQALYSPIYMNQSQNDS